MKRCTILLLTILLVTTTSFSSNILQKIDQDSIVLITSKQLKETNLIFVEHSKLLIENRLLFKQLENYKLENSILTNIDSIKSIQIENYKKISSVYNYELIKLKEENRKNNRKILGWKVGGITICTGLLLLLIFK